MRTAYFGHLHAWKRICRAGRLEQVIGHLQVRDISIRRGAGSYFDAGAGAGGAIVPIYTYTLDDANRATITGYSGNATALYIPGEIDGHEVVAIGDRAFENRTDLRTVMIPDSVTEIEEVAFRGCSNLVNITLSKNLKYMGWGAFEDCTKITKIEIPKSLEECGSSADYGHLQIAQD